MTQRPPLQDPRGLLSDDPLWYRDAVIYELRVRSFADSNGDGVGDFAGLTDRLPYLEDLGVTAVWLLPFYPSPLRDDGYDISDYTNVAHDCGTLDDFKRFLDEAHRRGLRVVTELVLNHTSDQHPWFQRARRSPVGSSWRDFYVWSDSPEKWPEARVIFKDFEPSNWTFDPIAKRYFWHRFYSHQPDLNFENPAVQDAMLGVMDFWFTLGVDGLRLDAVPYLYEKEGTNCENLPETHAFLRRLRTHVDTSFRNRMLLAEANQWPEDAARYFGQGDECHMSFHFPIMPRIFMSIHMEDRLPIHDILQQTPALPPTAQWALFLRNHDELTLEMVTDEERDYMYRAYAHEQTARINLGIRRRLAPLLGNDRRKMELMNGLLFSLPGTPVLYYGDEIGMGDNIYLGDRDGVRTPMQWSADRNAGFSRANPQRLILPVIIDPEYHYESLNVEAQQNNPNSLLWWTKRLVALRQKHRAFGRGSIEFLQPDNPRVLAFVRADEDAEILVVANLSRFVQFVELDLARWSGRTPVELSGRNAFPPIGDLPYLLTLGRHDFYWFRLDKPAVPGAEELRAEPVTLDVATLEDLWRGKVAVRVARALEPLVRLRRASPPPDAGEPVVHETLPLQGPGHGVQVVVVRSESARGEVAFTSAAVTVLEGDQAVEPRLHALHSVIAHVRRTGDERPAVMLDALSSPAAVREFLDVMLAGARHAAGGGTLVATGSPALHEPPIGAETRLLRGEHRRAVAVFGERAILRVLRRLHEGLSPEIELQRHFERHHLEAPVPKLLGAVEWARARSEPWTIATLQEFVPGAVTGESLVREELDRFFERVLTARDEKPPTPPTGALLQASELHPGPQVTRAMGPWLDTAHAFGHRLAELHLALSSVTDEPAFAPEPYTVLDQRSTYQGDRNLAGRVLRHVRQHLGAFDDDDRGLARQLLAREKDVFRRFEPLLSRRLSGTRTRYHGDARLAKTLYTGRATLFIGFDGDPSRPLSERRRKRSPIRDAAAYLESIDLAVRGALDDGALRPTDRSTLEPWARAWLGWTQAAFLRGYLESARGAGFLPHTHEELAVVLDVLVFEKRLARFGSRLLQNARETGPQLEAILHQLDEPAP